MDNVNRILKEQRRETFKALHNYYLQLWRAKEPLEIAYAKRELAIAKQSLK